ncbi:MAG: hypothetical protein JWQ49_5612 [Edaphobacter sp.]|nr:hypothetical protein [Edaphobacter sp.]
MNFYFDRGVEDAGESSVRILNSFEPGAASKELRETNFSSTVEDVMAKAGKDQDFDEVLSKIGPDATATFDNSPSNPTEHASSEATDAATTVNGRDAELEEEDDDLAALEEDDELDEEEDVEDEAGV